MRIKGIKTFFITVCWMLQQSNAFALSMAELLVRPIACDVIKSPELNIRFDAPADLATKTSIGKAIAFDWYLAEQIIGHSLSNKEMIVLGHAHLIGKGPVYSTDEIQQKYNLAAELGLNKQTIGRLLKERVLGDAPVAQPDAANFFERLGVPSTASRDEIQKAYRKASMVYHPDRNAGNPIAERSMKRINEAYEVLYDDAKRAEYLKKNGVKGSNGGSTTTSNTNSASTLDSINSSTTIRDATAVFKEFIFGVVTAELQTPGSKDLDKVYAEIRTQYQKYQNSIGRDQGHDFTRAFQLEISLKLTMLKAIFATRPKLQEFSIKIILLH